MAYSIPNLAIIELSYQMSYASQRYMCLFHYQYIGPTIMDGGAQLESLANFWADTNIDGRANEWRALLPDNVKVDYATAQYIHPIRYVRAVSPVGDFGTRAATASGNLAGVITKRSALASNHGIGSIHIPVSTSSFDVANGQLTPSLIEEYDNWAGIMAEQPEWGGEGGKLSPVILNKANPALSLNIEMCFPQLTARTMSRRTVGRGI